MSARVRGSVFGCFLSQIRTPFTRYHVVGAFLTNLFNIAVPLKFRYLPSKIAIANSARGIIATQGVPEFDCFNHPSNVNYKVLVKKLQDWIGRCVHPIAPIPHWADGDGSDYYRQRYIPVLTYICPIWAVLPQQLLPAGYLPISNDRSRRRARVTRYGNGPEGPAVVELPMKVHDDRNETDGRNVHSTTGFSDEQRANQRKRRIEQRRAVLNDPDLPHELRERAHRRMCELQRERDEE